jgi:hypothetical protein
MKRVYLSLFVLFFLSEALSKEVSQSLLVPPFFYQSWGPEKRLILTPIFGYFKDKRQEKGLFLNYFWMRTKDKEADIFFPFYFNFRDKRQVFTLFFPFGARWYGQGKDEAQVIFPFLWRFSLDQRDTWVVGPFYHSKAPKGFSLWIVPFFMIGKEKDRSYQIVPPLFWRFKNKDRLFMLAGPFYLSLREKTYSLGLFPIFFKARDKKGGYFIIPPLFFQFKNPKRTFWLLGPVYLKEKKGYFSLGVIPLYYMSKGKDDFSFTFFPLVHYKKGLRVFRLFTPIFWFHRKPKLDQGGILLYHWRNEAKLRFRTLFPFLWSFKRPAKKENTFFFFPFYYRFRSFGIKDDVVFPFFWRFSSIEKRDLFIFPLFLDLHKYYEKRTFGLLPFFIHHQRYYDGFKRTYVFPVFLYTRGHLFYHFMMLPIVYVGRDREASHQVVAPLFFRFWDPGGRDLVIFPLLWDFINNRGKERSTIFFPFFWRFRSDMGISSVGFPLWWDFRRFEPRSRASVFFPFFWRFDSPERTVTVALNMIYIRGKKKGWPSWSFHFFPLFSIGRPGPGNISWSLLYGLLGYQRQGSYQRIKILWIPINI